MLAILAVIATGVAGVYGRKNIDEAKDKMTLHEMREIKKAFLQFENDNFRRLKEDLVDHTGASLPTADFNGTFVSSPDSDDPIYQWMEFYETYGLWFLMQPRVPGLVENTDDSDESDEFPSFKDFDVTTCDGWNGPYLDTVTREAWVYDVTGQRIDGTYTGVEFPQVADKHGGEILMLPNIAAPDVVKPLGVYRLLYYEHCEDLSDLTEPIYRRLLLIAPRGNTDRDELTDDELLLETGNLRGGAGRPDGGPEWGRLNLSTGSFTNRETSPFFILELLNMDVLQR